MQTTEEEPLDEDIDFEKLEQIIDILLNALEEPDTLIRLNSSQGLGKIAGRLTLDLANIIVEKIHELFEKNSNQSSLQADALQGGCLALAELSRRGLLLPNKIGEFVPYLEKALVLDINLGNHSEGAHVRDAACYVVWAFARAYSPDIMKPFVSVLSTNLILVSLFD